MDERYRSSPALRADELRAAPSSTRSVLDTPAWPLRIGCSRCPDHGRRPPRPESKATATATAAATPTPTMATCPLLAVPVAAYVARCSQLNLARLYVVPSL